MKIIIGADHGGFQLKEELIKILNNFHVQVIDVGAFEYNGSDDYPDFAIAVAKMISNKEGDKGIIICGSGVGASVAANKIKGVRAAVCHDTYSAKQGVEHDDLNVLCLGGRIIGIEVAKELLSAFINAKYSGEERHDRRLKKILELEK